MIKNTIQLNKTYSIIQVANNNICFTRLYKNDNLIKESANVYSLLDYAKQFVRITKEKEKALIDFYKNNSK